MRRLLGWLLIIGFIAAPAAAIVTMKAAGVSVWAVIGGVVDGFSSGVQAPPAPPK